MTATEELPTVKAIAPWFGGNRLLAPAVGEEVAGSKWVGVPFAGGMGELLYIDAPSVVVNDKHRHVINLAVCIADDAKRQQVLAYADSLPFHPDALEMAQNWCLENREPETGDPIAAGFYFVAAWMARSGIGGTDDEFYGKTPVRWNGNGGDSNTRYRSAIRSMDAWSTLMKRCNFRTDDAFEFIEKCADLDRHALYVDPPFPGPGDKYRHKVDKAGQERLAELLAGFKKARIVCRFYDHPLIRELYPADRWTWRHLVGRKQSNEAAPEVLLINGPSNAKGGSGLFGSAD